jgi:hypothetical protein
MKKNSPSQSGIFNPRGLAIGALFSLCVLLAINSPGREFNKA